MKRTDDRHRPGASWPWSVVLPAVFVVVAGWQSVGAVLDWRLLGSHALIYTDAARAWLSGGNPWTVGPPAVVFAGPPTMLVPFVPFVALPGEVTRWVWVISDLLIAAWAMRTLRLPTWWLAFPPLVSAIELGHPEVLVLGLLVVSRPISGLAAIIKPYAALPLVAERNWAAIVLTVVLTVISIPLLPWGMFVENLPRIATTLGAQAVGDSVFGNPFLMLIALLTIVGLGWRRFLWLATPILWPSAQPIYKVPSMPMLSPIVALAWSVPIPGMTLAGLLVAAVLLAMARHRSLPVWVRQGLDASLMPVSDRVV